MQIIDGEERQRLERARLQTLFDIDLALKALERGDSMRDIVNRVSFLSNEEVKPDYIKIVPRSDGSELSGLKLSSAIMDEHWDYKAARKRNNWLLREWIGTNE